MPRALPSGTVTFLFTDVEGSTRLWEEVPDRAGPALARHDEIIEAAVDAARGHLVRPRGEGDSRFCVFERPTDALTAALAIQQGLGKEPWDLPQALKVRIGIHSGEAELRAGDYYGSAVNRCARLRGLAWGGQTLVSGLTKELLSSPLPAGLSVRDLGPHRLRDTAAPEHVFQLCHPDLPDDFKPLRSVDAVRNNLPAELTSFVGREQDVSTIKRLVGEERLVTLHGSAGCGKTRLALEVADEMIGTFPDGEWFVDLAPVSDPALIAEAVAGALGMRAERFDERDPGGVAGAIERVIEFLRPRHQLLVLDNCEHLIQASAAFAERVLRACPRVHVLATSREALGIDAEVAWRVPSLTTPGPGEDPDVETLGSYEACRLFLERARQRRPDLDVTARDAKAIAEICARLDGIPLAIELAAARVKVLTPPQIAERLSDFFRLLVGGSRTALERQQTLRAAVDWSFQPLDDTERALFRRLSVFVGGFGLEAAEAVCADDDVPAESILDTLTALADKSMIELDARPGIPRYRMLETFRQFAREKLFEAAEGDALRTRHRDHFLAMAEEKGADLWGPRQLAAADDLEVEHDNLRAALEWSTAETESDAAVRLLAALWPFWQARGHHAEWGAWIEQILPGATADPEVLARAWLGKAWLDIAHMRAAAEESVERALAAARDAGSVRWQVRAMTLLAEIHFMQGHESTEDRRSIEVAETLAREADDPLAIAWSLGARGRVSMASGDLDGARRSWEQALGHARRVGAPIVVAEFSLRLADMLWEREQDAAGARAMAETAYRVGDVELRAAALYRLAAIAIGEGETERARALIERGSATLEEIGGMDIFVFLRGILAAVEGDLGAARGWFRRADADAHARGWRLAHIRATTWLARVDRLEGKAREALASLRRCLRGSVSAGYLPVQPSLVGLIGGCRVALGEAEPGLTLIAAMDALQADLRIRPVRMDERIVEADLAAARAALDEQTAERAWAVGRALGIDAAIERALAP